ncbi:MotA/TolQ/ExbB proton channel family protein [Campylobacter ureolyticus]|jgi:biopolymer transport exbB protein|uniref:MotA/TolQ/ExbB proton channel family protein n=1 Tax=Campylobacter ureolyticus TaxID=827 RepID=UPI001FC80551|nr:MotA/TolQ/ExbB proton channel family protein [Campylobacter ureolyticus]MCZ6117363.1 MotA/TolQ/ExbB proton channel family protein [Campylobacter ureolyticus]MCZ6134585.1 MotA/TolQ/ExbB proton channel family protein [Campylobacter ureolyticus]MCZ6166855.1 MotA/TolQ/ExbB proton channel family protein [Campylobacter ureolyticus]MDK8322436.1 MotA/TolQ/ExbB proton channel family protein [Campylobacter ureolyticus]GKH59863.1 biopolymer transporter ExbB [Campylobacter ureolyticus]
MKKIFFMFFIVVGLCFAENNLQSKNLNTSNLVENLQNLDENLPQNSKNYQHSNLNLNQNLDLNSKIQTKEKSKFTLFSLYENADMVVKFVIYILVIFSLLTWSVLIAKVIEFWRYKKILKLDLFYTRKAIFLEDLPTLKENSFMEIFKNEAIIEMEKSKKLNGTKSRIRTNFEIKINSIITNAKNLTSILASIGSSAPFIGLFGTVWGIMNSFIGIAGSNDTGLDVVAPGIAEALFATAFGLAAAIPAVLFYNYITRKTAKFANEIDEIATAVYLIADRTLDKK